MALLRNGFIAVALAAVSLFLLWPIISSGQWYEAKQAYRYPYLTDLFKASFLAGHIYPRWLPELAGGYGYPTFIFYPPGFWFLALPYALLLDTIPAMYLTLITILMIGGAGAFLLARQQGLTHLYALAAAAVFLTTPYIVHQLYIRGSLAELLAMMLCPWALWSYFRVLDCARGRRALFFPSLQLSIFLAAVVYAHPLVAFWLGAGLAIIFASQSLIEKGSSSVWPAMIAVALMSLSFSAPYWFSAWFLKEEVQFRLALQAPRPMSWEMLFGWQDWQLLNPAIVFIALSGLLLTARRPLSLPLLAVCLYMIGALLMPAGFWERFPVLAFGKVSVRVISALAVFLLMGVVAMGCWLQRSSVSPPVKHGLMILIVLSAIVPVLPHIRLQGTEPYDAYKIKAHMDAEDMTHFHEFTPLTAVRGGPPAKDVIGIVDASAGRNDDIHMTAAASPIIIDQFWFPGWKFSLGDETAELGESHMDSYGRIQLKIMTHNSEPLHIWYDGPPYWEVRNAAMAVIVAASAVFLYWNDRRRARNYPVPFSPSR